MEAEVPSVGDINRMGSTQCTLARRALGSNGSYESGHGRRQLSNDQVREQMGLYTVESTLRARRLKWWQDSMTSPSENKQLLAALFGTMGGEVRETTCLGTNPMGRTASTGSGSIRGHYPNVGNDGGATYPTSQGHGRYGIIT